MSLLALVLISCGSTQEGAPRTTTPEPTSGSDTLPPEDTPPTTPTGVERVSCGTPELVHLLSASGDDKPTDLEPTPDGGVVLAGTFEGTITLPGSPDPVEVVGEGLRNGLLLKLSADGSVEWVRNFTAPGRVLVWMNDLAVVPDGTIYVGADHDQSFAIRVPGEESPLATVPYEGPGIEEDSFLARFDSAGGLDWVTTIFSDESNAVRGVAVPVDGSAVYVLQEMDAGETRILGTDGGVVVVANPKPGEPDSSHENLLLVRFEPDGTFGWAVQVHSDEHVNPEDVIATDTRVTVVVEARAELSIEEVALPMPIGDGDDFLDGDAVVLGLDPADGAFLSGSSETGPAREVYFGGMHVPDGLATYGFVSTDAVVGAGTRAEIVYDDPELVAVHYLLSRFDAQGVFQGASEILRVGDTSIGLPSLLAGAADSSGRVAVGGGFSMDTTFEDHQGTVTLTRPDDVMDGGVMLVEPDGELACMIHLPVQAHEDEGKGGLVTGLAFTDGFLWIAAELSGALTLPDGTIVTSNVHGSGGSYDIALLRVPLSTYTE